jgi:hypothetical protein
VDQPHAVACRQGLSRFIDFLKSGHALIIAGLDCLENSLGWARSGGAR